MITSQRARDELIRYRSRDQQSLRCGLVMTQCRESGLSPVFNSRIQASRRRLLFVFHHLRLRPCAWYMKARERQERASILYGSVDSALRSAASPSSSPFKLLSPTISPRRLPQLLASRRFDLRNLPRRADFACASLGSGLLRSTTRLPRLRFYSSSPSVTMGSSAGGDDQLRVQTQQSPLASQRAKAESAAASRAQAYFPLGYKEGFSQWVRLSSHASPCILTEGCSNNARSGPVCRLR